VLLLRGGFYEGRLSGVVPDRALGEPRYSLDAGPGGALHGAQVEVAALRHQQDQRNAVLAEIGEGAVPELVKGRAKAAELPRVALTST